MAQFFARPPAVDQVRLRPWQIALILSWTLFVLISLVWNLYNERNEVFEGVESTIELDELRRLGCDAVQGYYFGRPMPADEASLLLAEEQSNAKRTSAE